MIAALQWVIDLLWPSAGLYDVDAKKVLEFAIPVIAIFPTVLLANVLERKRPIENHDNPEARATIHTEWLLVAFMATAGIFVQIALYVLFAQAATVIGGPLIYLEAQSVLGSIALIIVYAFPTSFRSSGRYIRSTTVRSALPSQPGRDITGRRRSSSPRWCS